MRVKGRDHTSSVLERWSTALFTPIVLSLTGENGKESLILLQVSCALAGYQMGSALQHHNAVVEMLSLLLIIEITDKIAIEGLAPLMDMPLSPQFSHQ